MRIIRLHTSITTKQPRKKSVRVIFLSVKNFVILTILMLIKEYFIHIQMNTEKSEDNWTELKIIEPIRKYSKEFNTPDEFNLWYSKHKRDVDSMTTHKLNKLYHINGYRITKIKGTLMLKRFEPKEEKNTDSEILSIKENIRELQDAVNSIILHLKGAQESQPLIDVSTL